MKQLSLFELNQLVRDTLDSQLEPSYWVVAEIGEMRSNQNGHCYLELVEKINDKVVAKMRGTIWSYTYRNLSTWFEGMTGQVLQPGLKILCNVTVQFHELYGLSVNIRDIDASFTLGERAQRRKKVIAQLIDDGVFEMNKSLFLPMVPQRIAVISSPTAAGFGDFMDQLNNNAYGYCYQVNLYQATMQGDQACASIINAMLRIHNSNMPYDALIIIRGGGSQLDLDCFDDYNLATHIAQFPLPIITGIGHDRDETIADLVAHTKMKTPTAVAEFLIGGIKSFEDRLDDYFSRIYHYTRNVLHLYTQKISTCSHRLEAISRSKLMQSRHQLEHYDKALKTQTRNYLNLQIKNLDMAQKALELLDPETTLKRGYSISTINGKVIKSNEIQMGDTLQTQTSHLIITSKIEKYYNKDKSHE